MSCEHEVRFTIKPTDDACRFHFDVRAYKDRIVAPDEYSGATEVTPSHIEQVLPTKDKLVRDDITIFPAPTEYLSTDHNGTFTPSDGHVGFSSVNVDVPIPTFETEEKTITLNGTYAAEDDEVDGYSEVTVNVQNGATMTEVANTYGTGVVITSAQGAGPSATRHTLYFEYEDETTETVYAYYDDALISSAITATTPTTHNNKTVTSAQLDGVEWYSYTPTPGPTPGGDYTTLYDGSVTTFDDDGDNKFTVPEMASVWASVGDIYRITINGTEYITQGTTLNTVVAFGNVDFFSTQTGMPFIYYHLASAYWEGFMRQAGTYTLKVEKQESA